MTGLLLEVYSLDWVPVPVWFVLGFLAVLAVSVLVALVAGRTVRRRDGRVPDEAQQPDLAEREAFERYARDDVSGR